MIGKQYCRKWIEQGENLKKYILENVFKKSRTVDYTDVFEAKSGLAIKCLREPTSAKGSTKKVILGDQEPVYCWIAKVIIYVPLNVFGEDHIKYCSRRKS